MITEDYISFETAKLLKEKGFDVKCSAYYISDDEIALLPIARDFNNNGIFLSAPTLQMAMKWLREEKHIYIQIMLDSWACGEHSGYYVVIQKTDSDFELMLGNVLDEVFYQTYEEACEAAIRYCLENLI